MCIHVFVFVFVGMYVCVCVCVCVYVCVCTCVHVPKITKVFICNLLARGWVRMIMRKPESERDHEQTN